MTAPDRSEITPGVLQAAVSVDGANGAIPALSTLDQPTAEALLKELYIKHNDKINHPLRDIFGGLRDGIPLGHSLIEALVQSILGLPGIFLSIAQARAALRAHMGGITDELTEHTEAIANLNEITAAMNTTPAYVGDLQDMVTALRSMLVVPGPRVGSVTDRHVDVVAGFGWGAALGVGFCLPVFTPKTNLFSSTGTIYYSPIVVDRKGTIDKLRWIVGSDTSISGVDYYEMALCVYNPANGNVEKVYGSGNIKDGLANTTNLREVSLAMGLNQQVTPGQVLMVAHQQVAPGVLQQSRTFAAVPQGNVGRTPDLAPLDAWCFTAPDFTTGIPSSIAFSSLTKENRFIPWAAVSVDAPVTP